MNRVTVKSESGRSYEIGYEGETLEIKFPDGSVYRYANVNPAIHRALMASQSKGSFIHKNIKGKFDFAKVGK